MSGIMAAKTLADSGVTDFLILEATEKIWVRMRSQKFRGINVELGANWVEGVNGAKTNPIWELARLHNLRTFFSGWNITDNICTDKFRVVCQLLRLKKYARDLRRPGSLQTKSVFQDR
ncbi:polyamine oxidase isoform X4 [Selaginella moellendorffii]|uniref:polyamine oxidase isoform X4 n=1 Tax=Selaginella moellendorffii TaxID=88036 RepID=UPI000D1C7F40|nr:polyamine oxidase isoform X4 [Selaginella moellendorffii]|eukprot:XP_024535881.1 polyamine oxidase isoform X4 [Selaginella moellendorffii]